MKPKTQECRICGVVKELGCFSPDSGNSSGRHYYCKMCRSKENTKQAREWASKNPERARGFSASFREKNRDRFRMAYKQLRDAGFTKDQAKAACQRSRENVEMLLKRGTTQDG